MKCSVIVISWNAMQYIPACLEHLQQAVADSDTEIIFIDNGSVDDTELFVREHYPHIRYRNLGINKGVAGARNVGISMASGDYIWLLDVDTEANCAAFTAMKNYLDTHPQTGICATKLVSAQGDAQQSCLKMPTLTQKFKNVIFAFLNKLPLINNFRFIRSVAGSIWYSNRKYFYLKEMEQDIPFTCEYVIGACQMIRRDLIDEIGYLDERIFYGPEDADFCLRCWKYGKEVVYIPYVSIIHHYQKITNKKIFSKMSWMHVKGLIHFFWKHQRLFRTGVK
ncbi:MAG: glycosyltransferase family 2 protein [Bacteroidales bacterium]|jgi:GT2 family glycosyltransferase|nr:glycosyltransferase family 2 protein [Bacteroidales bacterium]MDD4394344.1 glycosyltransferase family 2 protein [Bacteroidales bacterium]